jgi:hypothetical protein
MVTRHVWIHWKVTEEDVDWLTRQSFLSGSFRAGHSKSTICMVCLSCVACCHSLLELVGVGGGEDPMVFQFLWAFSTLKAITCLIPCQTFVFFHFYFPTVLCTSWVGVSSVLFTGQNFNLQKEWFQPIQRIFHEKKWPKFTRFWRKNEILNHQIFMVSSSR